MNLLYANDRAGCYPDSWYAATTAHLEPFEPLKGKTKADVCVVGAGYTGLSAALHLAESGRDVALIDAHRVGFGASGRNGGQLGSGQRMDQKRLEKLVGQDDALKLWELGEDAKDLVKSLIARHKIECHLKPGIAHACYSGREMADEHAQVEHLQCRYGYDQIEPLDHDALQAICPSLVYAGGSLDMGAGHLHPLAYALGLARAATVAGVRIFENTEVHEIRPGAKPMVRGRHGQVEADHVILACNGYLGGLDRKVAARVMPINNFIAATEPLGDEAAKVLARDVAIADTKFVINYFRLSHDKRLLFGGGESYSHKFPSDIAATVRKPMVQVFPHLSEVKIDYTWGGTLGITMKRMPYLARLAPNILTASGYSGHGVGTATHSGWLMAQAIIDSTNSSGFDILARIPTPSFPGGTLMRSPLLMLAMTWYAMRDRIGT